MATPILNYWRKPRPTVRHEGVTAQDVMTHFAAGIILVALILASTLSAIAVDRVVVIGVAGLALLITIATLGRKLRSARKKAHKGWISRLERRTPDATAVCAIALVLAALTDGLPPWAPLGLLAGLAFLLLWMLIEGVRGWVYHIRVIRRGKAMRKARQAALLTTAAEPRRPGDMPKTAWPCRRPWSTR